MSEVQQILDYVVAALDDLKGVEIRSLDVRRISDVTDWMLLASGTSSRHVRALVDNVLGELKSRGIAALGVEGRESSEWVLVDFGDVVVHVMQKETREYYDLERLWTELPQTDSETTH